MSAENRNENPSEHDEALALRILENVHAEDGTDDAPIEPDVINRMRAAIDLAFERAWKEVHAQAEAEARAREAARASRRSTLAGMSRVALMARLVELQAQPRLRVQVAFRNAEGVSDDDLRAMIEDLETHAANADPAEPDPSA